MRFLLKISWGVLIARVVLALCLEKMADAAEEVDTKEEADIKEADIDKEADIEEEAESKEEAEAEEADAEEKAVRVCKWPKVRSSL